MSLDHVLSPGSARKHINARKPHYVYQFFDRRGECLYVGCTVQPAGRISQHVSKPWWGHVAKIIAEVYPDKETGRAAELDLIHELQPLYNFQGTEKAYGPRK